MVKKRKVSLVSAATIGSESRREPGAKSLVLFLNCGRTGLGLLLILSDFFSISSTQSILSIYRATAPPCFPHTSPCPLPLPVLSPGAAAPLLFFFFFFFFSFSFLFFPIKKTHHSNPTMCFLNRKKNFQIFISLLQIASHGGPFPWLPFLHHLPLEPLDPT